MKLKLFLLITLAIGGPSYSQIVTTLPAYPTENDSIVVYFDATQSGASELLNYTGTVYAHTGVYTNLDNTKWLYVKGSWGNNTTQPALTRLGTNSYKLTIGNPRQFFGITNPAEHITTLNFVFREASGNPIPQTSPDIHITLYTAGTYSLVLNQPSVTNEFNDPARSPYFLSQNGTVNIIAKAAALGIPSSSITLSVNGQQKYSVSGDSLNYLFNAANFSTGLNNVEIIGKNVNNQADTLNFAIMINPPITNATKPADTEPGINYYSNDPTKVTLELFAPHKSFVYAIGDFNNWQVNTAYLMNRDSVSADSVIWWINLTVSPDTEYAFQYLVDGNLRIADPFTHKILDPANDQYISSTIYPGLKPYPSGKTSEIVSVLQTNQPQYNWTVNNFQKPDKSKLVIYELLVRDFVSTHWFKTVMDTLNYLKNLGVNAIELMPVMEFEGNDSWGYNPSFHLALDKYYGTPDAFKALIDSAHSKGMAVLLDIVLNHAYGQSPLVRLYWDAAKNRPALNNPWFNDTSRNTDFSFGYDFNHESSATQYYVDRVTSYWINQYHIDGYRFDFTKGFTNTTGNGSAYDSSRISILERMANIIWSVDPTSILILENFVDNNEEKVESDFGFLSWGNMNYNYNEATMGYNQPGHSDLSNAYYVNRGWPKPSLVTYMESHDEERLMYKNEHYGNISPGYSTKDVTTALERMGEAAAFFFTIPGPKMIWQFGELGYDYTINLNGRTGAKPIRWDYYNVPARQKLYRIYSALIRLKNSYSVFQSAATLNVTDSLKSIKFSDPTMKVNIIGNFGVLEHNMNPDFQSTGTWYDFFSGNSINVTNTTANINLQAGEYHIYTTTKLFTPDITTGIERLDNNIVTNYRLSQNYPNPFNPSTVINYQIPESGKVTLKIYDILGREVRTLVDTYQQSGSYKVKFEASKLASGIYFYQLQTNNFVSTKKMILMK